MPDETLILTVIVNGKPVDVTTSANAALESVIVRALEQTGNQGQPPDQWELRDAQGAILDPGRSAEDYGFGPGTRLFLNLKAGVGG